VVKRWINSAPLSIFCLYQYFGWEYADLMPYAFCYEIIYINTKLFETQKPTHYLISLSYIWVIWPEAVINIWVVMGLDMLMSR